MKALFVVVFACLTGLAYAQISPEGTDNLPGKYVFEYECVLLLDYKVNGFNQQISTMIFGSTEREALASLLNRYEAYYGKTINGSTGWAMGRDFQDTNVALFVRNVKGTTLPADRDYKVLAKTCGKIH